LPTLNQRENLGFPHWQSHLQGKKFSIDYLHQLFYTETFFDKEISNLFLKKLKKYKGPRGASHITPKTSNTAKQQDHQTSQTCTALDNKNKKSK
jgi:hypothetical protein